MSVQQPTMTLVEAVQKCSVDDEKFEKFKQELQRVYREELGQERGDRVRFRTLLAALTDSSNSDLDYLKLLMKAVQQEWVESTDQLDLKSRKIWLSGDGDGPNQSITIDEVEEAVCANLGEHLWKPAEAAMSAHTTLLIPGVDACTGLVLTGPSGCGKTTTLRLIEEAFGVYRSDDVTPKAFVSHDSSYSEEDLEEVDLLPRIKAKTLLIPDMANWFSGNQEVIRSRMSTLAIVMDGRGYTRDSGAQGERGYEGDYRFSLVGATTPLKPRAWDVMGHTGQRLLFYEMPDPGSVDDVADDVFEGSELREKINRAKSSVVGYLKALWKHHGGPRSVKWESDADEEIQQALKYLARLVRYGRAPLENGSPTKEAPHRILHRLYDIARGRALLYDREQLVIEDAEMCAHIALSTMPEKRREIIRPVVNPHTDNELTASQIEPWVDLRRKTIIDRLETLEKLEMGTVVEEGGRSTKVFTIDEDFVWPEYLSFPERK